MLILLLESALWGAHKATETVPRLCSFMHKPEDGAQHEDLAQAADVEFSEHTQERIKSPGLRDQPAHALSPTPGVQLPQARSQTQHSGSHSLSTGDEPDLCQLESPHGTSFI